jgi:hypothetical protein
MKFLSSKIKTTSRCINVSIARVVCMSLQEERGFMEEEESRFGRRFVKGKT